MLETIFRSFWTFTGTLVLTIPALWLLMALACWRPIQITHNHYHYGEEK